MKASEVLARYRNGDRDFQGVNLRGQSFRGQDLSGADFSGADIRGTNFRGAILRGTKFCRARAGLQKRWVFVLLGVCVVLAGIAGVLLGFAGALTAFIFDSSNLENRVAGWTVLFTLVFFYGLIFRQGLGRGTAFAVAFTVAFAVARAEAVAGALAGAGAGAFVVVAFAFAVAFTVAGAVAFTGAFTGAVAFTRAFTGAVAVAFAVAGAVAFAVAFTGAGAVAFAVAGAVIGMALSCYLGWRAIQGDPRDAFIRSISVALAATGGTTFREAELTDADFEGATLKNTDFRESNLTRTNFQKTGKLFLARPGTTILANSTVRELLLTRQGEGKDYTGANLRGANLVGANLRGATLKLADLADANLEYANLERANLSQANAVGTNFRRASLTGACIEAWNIESNTILDEVDCRYLYLLEHPKPNTDDRERRPSSGEFGEGEFTKLFSEVMDTVDLIFRDGVDWKAFVSAFKQVRVENEETPLEVQGFENKGDGVVVVKVKIPPNTDKEKIHREFTDYYDLALKAAEEKYKAQLDAKENEIAIYRQQNADMMEIAKLLAAKPIHFSDNSKNISIGGNLSGSVVNVADSIERVNIRNNRVDRTLDRSSIDPKNRDKNSADFKLELLRTLKGLIPPDLNELLLYLAIPPGIVPPPNVESATRVDALWNWAESPTGCGLDALEEALETIRNKP